MSPSFVKKSLPARYIITALGLSLVILTGSANADTREQARRIYDRLAGVPPTNDELDTMESSLALGQGRQAAQVAIDNPNFLNVTVKNMVIPWTNKDQTMFAPLNDTAATIIGMIRDGSDFRNVLYGDVLYTGTGVTAGYSNTNNLHYEELENSNAPLKDVLVAVSQSATTLTNPAGVAGVMTTRAASRAFFNQGTNRAMLRFTMMNYLCLDLEQVKDITRVPDRIRQDVSRSPGGDSSVFLNNCIGCHAGMDGLAGAYAQHEWLVTPEDAEDRDTGGRLHYATAGSPAPVYTIGSTTYTGELVQKKNRINPNNFKYGYYTTSDEWINYWRTGANAKLGWDGSQLLGGNYQPYTASQTPSTGIGMATLGQELANTDAFARCQVKKVYRHVCFNDPDPVALTSLMGVFITGNYNLRTVFAEAALLCKGN